MKFHVKNWTDMDTVGVEPSVYKADDAALGRPLVTVSQMIGSLSFQFSVTPDQARWMATALQLAAEEAEKRADL